MTRVTDPRQLPALTALWRACFGDTEAEVLAFWRDQFDASRVYAEFAGGRAVSMLCALPAELVGDDGAALPCVYLYAVCTAPAARGQGHAHRLLQFALHDCAAAGYAAAALVPAEAALFRFYAGQGFRTAFFCREYTVPARPLALKLRPVNAEDYRALRELQLYGSFLSYPARLLSLEDGHLYRADTADGIFCFCAERAPEGNTLRIRELLPDAPELAAALAAHFGCENAAVRTAGGSVPVGMLRALSDAALPEAAYLSLDFS